jgi:superfamily I DNA/RNA helicase/mRNA-degrading endonuclease RelE of RelBE toxin-antitoxin system
MSVQLRMLESAAKEVDKLPRSVKGAIYDFQRKFRQDLRSPGLRFKQLAGDSQLYSARVTDDYRAIMARVSGTEFLLVAVKPRQSAYDNLERYAYQVNPVTGGIEFLDIVHVDQQVFLDEAKSPHAQATASAAPGAQPAAAVPLFAAYFEAQLLDLGVAAPLLPLIAKVTTEDELLALVEYAPQLSREVLLALHDGMASEDVLEQVTAPLRAASPVNTADFEAALARPATQVTTDDAALQAVLEGDFTRWQVFLHPAQRAIAERSYSGPARVSGGPGTGKTIVALHRVRYLAKRLPAGDDKDILLTTFNKNLAADLRGRLLELGGPGLLQRVDVVNIDALASRIATEAEPAVRRHWLDDSKAVERWQDLLGELGITSWSAEFLHDEWSQVVLGHAINSRDEYFRVRRVGRGRTLSRPQRAEVWQLVEQFTKRLANESQWTFRQVAARAARLEAERAKTRGARYRHAVVDEAQDLSPAHWMLLRAMVAPGPNDLFIAGDTHQRIYDNYVSLASLGINIRGRSSRLTLSYRSTHEILSAAEALLGTEEWDDLDGGTDTLAGYRSVLRGPRPSLRGYATWADEVAGIISQVKEWLPADGSPFSVGVAVPENRLVDDVLKALDEASVEAASIGRDGPRKPGVVHVGTLHRFKGLEYQMMLIADASAGAIPSAKVVGLRTEYPERYDRQLRQARSLLFVAATRARDTLAITWHGDPSPFLPQAPLGAPA